MKKLFILPLFALSVQLMAQKTLSLKECLQIGIENNLSLRASQNEVKKAMETISENRAKLLPQINLVGSFNDNFDPPVSVTDGRAYGKQYNVTQTLQYNAAGGLQLQMPLYSQMAYTAADLARTMARLNELSYEKAREDLIVQIASIYYLIQNTKEQIGIINDNIKRFEELKEIAKAFYDNQMALEVDLQRINVRIENTQIQSANALAMLTKQYNMLKYILDYPAEEEIEVIAKSVDEVEAAEMSGLNENMYELQLMQQKVALADQQTKLAKQGYLPTLALTGNVMYTAFSDKFKNWFHDTEANHWYNSNGIGISLRVPVFDGFEKRSKVRKAKIDAETARLGFESTLKGMQTNYANAVKDLTNNQRNYFRQRDNYRLAENIYDATYNRYKERIVSMVEVLTDQMSMSDAQNSYLTSHYEYMVSNLQILKYTGKLETLLF